MQLNNKDKNEVIHGSSPELIKALSDAGVVPDNCKRVVIDIAFNDVIKIYYEVYGDKRLLDVDLVSHLKVVKEKACS